jgi:Tfp pilus assembly protein PilF
MRALLHGLLVAALLPLVVVGGEAKVDTVKPPWQRLLQGEDARQAARLRQQIDSLVTAKRWREARQVAEELAALRTQKQGKDHWEALDARWETRALKRVEEAPAPRQSAYASSLSLRAQVLALESKGQYAAAFPSSRQVLAIFRDVLGEEDPQTAAQYNNLALNQKAQGKYAEAEEDYSKALAIYRKVLGEEHPDTAICYHNLAHSQSLQGKYALAEAGYRKALAICRGVLGAGDAGTANCWISLGMNQSGQGKFVEAEEGLRKGLAIFRKVLGEEHPRTAQSYGNLANNQNAQGKHARAEAGFRKALAILRMVHGEAHPDTATSYSSLAFNQHKQGNYAAAEINFRKALDVYRKVLGEEHPLTAACTNSLAVNHSAQGKHVEAEADLRKALAIRRKVLGEEHPETGQSYNCLAVNQNAQRKYALAEAKFRKGLAISRKVYGEQHPSTASCYSSLAINQQAQGKYAEAEAGFRKALSICLEVYGEDHLDTAIVYHGLAANQHARGKYAEAEQLATKAAAVFARTRQQFAATGLDRATITTHRSPLSLLAILLARNGKPAGAWQRFEESLGRGTGDDLAARLKRPAAERQRQAELLARLGLLDAQLQKLAAIRNPTAEHQKQRQRLLAAQLRAHDALARFSQELEEKYGPVAGQVLDLAGVQKALPADAAFLAWLDLAGEHWAVLLKARGAPVWARLPGSGPNRAWVEADDALLGKARAVLVRAAGDWQPLARQLYAQRLAPLAGQLKGVKQLVALPSAAMDGIPVEVIAEGCTVSYASSASLFAHQKRQPRPKSSGLVALGDPDFQFAPQAERPLPPGGLLLTVVPPRSAAALAGLKSGDVLLKYGDTSLNALSDLQKAMARPDRAVSVRVWRLDAGATKARELTLRVPAGRLGVLLAPQPAPKALAAQRQNDRLLAARDDSTWPPLPGTRYEVSALARLFAARKPTVLLGSNASETRLAELAKDGTLGQARFVHLATHGEARADKPLASRIILSRNRLSEDQRGELSAEQVLTGWQLNAELVTLSACQTGLGKYESGEGFVGFAQALILAGARSVCLSRWSVNDLSTALLMERFYQNLLGKRPGLQAPLGKAAALAEAKRWLRTLPRAEALERAEAIGAGVARAPGARELPRVKVPAGPRDEPPYAHPYYWAGFVLFGDRD